MKPQNSQTFNSFMVQKKSGQTDHYIGVLGHWMLVECSHSHNCFLHKIMEWAQDRESNKDKHKCENYLVSFVPKSHLFLYVKVVVAAYLHPKINLFIQQLLYFLPFGSICCKLFMLLL